MEEIKNRILEALYSLPAILIGLSFHEWGHAYAAYKRGDPTARNLGRMTVNPLAHIDPVGFLSLLILGFAMTHIFLIWQASKAQKRTSLSYRLPE